MCRTGSSETRYKNISHRDNRLIAWNGTISTPVEDKGEEKNGNYTKIHKKVPLREDGARVLPNRREEDEYLGLAGNCSQLFQTTPRPLEQLNKQALLQFPTVLIIGNIIILLKKVIISEFHLLLSLVHSIHVVRSFARNKNSKKMVEVYIGIKLHHNTNFS